MVEGTGRSDMATPGMVSGTVNASITIQWWRWDLPSGTEGCFGGLEGSGAGW